MPEIKDDAADAVKAKANATQEAAADFAEDPAEAPPAASAAKDGPKAPETPADAQASATKDPEPYSEGYEAVESQEHADHPSRLRPAMRPARQGP